MLFLFEEREAAWLGDSLVVEASSESEAIEKVKEFFDKQDEEKRKSDQWFVDLEAEVERRIQTTPTPKDRKEQGWRTAKKMAIRQQIIDEFPPRPDYHRRWDEIPTPTKIESRIHYVYSCDQ